MHKLTGTIINIISIIISAILIIYAGFLSVRNWNDEDSILVKVWIIFYILLWIVGITGNIMLLSGNNIDANRLYSSYDFYKRKLMFDVVFDIFNSIVYFTNYTTTEELRHFVLAVMILYYVFTGFDIYMTIRQKIESNYRREIDEFNDNYEDSV